MTAIDHDGKIKFSANLMDAEKTNDKPYEPWLPSPPKLVQYAGDFVNEMPMPICWEWTVDEVVEWLKETVRLPQYEDCLRRNFINGRRILLLETQGFQKIGIYNFSHVKKISAAVRELFGVEKAKYNRSLSLAPRHPWTHYLLYRSPTGPTREATSPFELFQNMGILDKSDPCPFGHWEMIEPAWGTFPYNRFGLITRKDVYRRVEFPRQPRGHSYLKKSKIRANYFVRVDVK